MARFLHSLRFPLLALAALLSVIAILYAVLTLMSGVEETPEAGELTYEQKMEILTSLRGGENIPLDRRENTLSAIEEAPEPLSSDEKMNILRGLK